MDQNKHTHFSKQEKSGSQEAVEGGVAAHGGQLRTDQRWAYSRGIVGDRAGHDRGSTLKESLVSKKEL